MQEKEELTAFCLFLFSKIWLAKTNSQSKYNQACLWLFSYRQVIHPNVRDIFSTGGKKISVNDHKLNYDDRKSHVIKTLVDSFALIK